jgi:DNA-binding transcriptional LysR family regulator
MSAMPIAAPPLHFRAVCVLPPGHRLAALRTVPLAELEGERCVLLGRQFRLGDMIEELFERHGVAPLYVAETQNASAACAMAAAGMGVTVVDPVTPRTFGDRVVVRRLDPAVDFPVQILAPPGRPMSRLSAGFIGMLRQELATFGVGDEKPDPRQP